MHLVGVIIRIYHDARSPECQKNTGCLPKERPYFVYVFYGPKTKEKLHKNMCPKLLCFLVRGSLMRSEAPCVPVQGGHLLCKVCRCTVGSESGSQHSTFLRPLLVCKHTSLTPRSRVILEKPTGSQTVK